MRPSDKSSGVGQAEAFQKRSRTPTDDLLEEDFRPLSPAGDGELRAAGLTRPIIALNQDLRMPVVSTPGMHL
jgi:hypothetical protein